MGANAGAPNDQEMQMGIVKDSLTEMMKMPSAGKIIPLPYEYTAEV
jgi:D-proline reductase (dithiol) PrdB